MKKTFILVVFVVTLLGAPVLAAPTAFKPVCGLILRRYAPTEFRGVYRYDVLVGLTIRRWSAPTRYAVGARMCLGD